MFEFKSDKDYRFNWPVKVLVPTVMGQEEQKFTGYFRLVPPDELDKAIAADPVNADRIVARLSLTGWGKDLVQDRQPLAYSPAQHEALIGLPFARYGIAKAYWEAVNGALRLKNSEALPVAG